jgi:hypothetical protein
MTQFVRTTNSQRNVRELFSDVRTVHIPGTPKRVEESEKIDDDSPIRKTGFSAK